MRRVLPLLLFGFAVPGVSGLAQTSCSSPANLTQAARQVASIRHELHEVAVRENDPQVPAPVANQLQQLKAALAQAADVAFACTSPDATPETIQSRLAEALHANTSQAAETVVVTRNKKDLGAYGSDLAVQVFPLFSSPRYYEVDFRYGVECGDDNLLMVFEAGSGGWHQVLRWGAPHYDTVSDAYGDFVLLTPLSGFPGQRNWRFVVAHGEPACTAQNAPSNFDLDLLEPTADPAQPTVVWHLHRADVRDQIPRLSTTEDTLTFELAPPEEKAAGARSHASGPNNAIFYRFRVTKDNQVEPVVNALSGAGAGVAADTQ